VDEPVERQVTCAVCGQPKRLSEVFPTQLVREAVLAAIRRDHPKVAATDYICLTDLNQYRMERVKQLVEEEIGGLSNVELEVVRSLQDRDLMSRNVNQEFAEKITFGQRIADRVASFGGSWPFIFMFGGVLLVWITLNTSGALPKTFDPYPFILLNLVLSCLAAIQAPVIMMSQNRQEARDRIRAELDYQVNLKAELEVRGLNARVEELLRHQWQGLLEIQQLQAEMMGELVRQREGQTDA
jgi:uncharacterized membrane protein